MKHLYLVKPDKSLEELVVMFDGGDVTLVNRKNSPSYGSATFLPEPAVKAVAKQFYCSHARCKKGPFATRGAAKLHEMRVHGKLRGNVRKFAAQPKSGRKKRR